jgi:DNA-binding IclR family transcriptional regulator
MKSPVPGNQSIEKGFALLELLDSNPDGLGVREIARRLDLHPSNVHRLISTLVGIGYVEKNPANGHYRLGLKAYFLGQSSARQDVITTAAIPEMERISADLGLSVYLGVRRDNFVVYMHYVAGSAFMSVPVAPGDKVYLHSTALGKVLISQMAEKDIRTLLGDEPLPKRTPLTITTYEKLFADLTLADQNGYSLVVEEDSYGIVSVGAPLHDSARRTVAAISVAFPLSSNLDAMVQQVAPIVKVASEKISGLISLNRPATSQ